MTAAPLTTLRSCLSSLCFLSKVNDLFLEAEAEEGCLLRGYLCSLLELEIRLLLLIDSPLLMLVLLDFVFMLLFERLRS